MQSRVTKIFQKSKSHFKIVLIQLKHQLKHTILLFKILKLAH